MPPTIPDEEGILRGAGFQIPWFICEPKGSPSKFRGSIGRAPEMGVDGGGGVGVRVEGLGVV